MTRRPAPPPPRDAAALVRVLHHEHPDPHSVLGAFPHPCGTLVRVLKPGAVAVSVRTADALHPLAPVDPRPEGRRAGAHPGMFAAVLPVPAGEDYRLVVTYPPGRTYVVPDGYTMAATVSEDALRRFAAGTDRRLWESLGARPTMMGTPTGAVSGTAFAVWAPHARGVSVIGGFDGWTGLGAPMRRLSGTGVWEVFVPGVGPGELYKFRIRAADGTLTDRADPMAQWAEAPPNTASRVTAERHRWSDGAWQARRAAADPRRRPMSTYEVHLGSWRPGLDYDGLAAELVPYVARLGFTHVELLPLAEHPYGGSWGYQVTSQFAPTARLGDPDGLRRLVDAFHAAGIGVIADWVPAHFPRDGWALARFDGAALYEPDDPLRADHPDWGTLTFDLARPEVRSFLLSSALYWIERFHLDGLRVDAVASLLYRDYSRRPGRWTPNARGGREDLAAVGFLRELTAAVARRHPGVSLIAEDSSLRPGTTAPVARGGLGFTFRWNLGWLHDSLGAGGPLPAVGAPAGAARTLDYACDESYVLPISHDEVVHGKGTPWQRFSGPPQDRADRVRAALATMWAHPGKKLLFMGQEYGQETEWSDLYGPDWAQLRDPLHVGVRDLVARLNVLYRSMPALWLDDGTPGGFTRLGVTVKPATVTPPVLAFARHTARDPEHSAALICVANMSADHVDASLRAPFAGDWRIVLDAGACGQAGRRAAAVAGTRRIRVAVPARSTVWLVREPADGSPR
ncbi:1,4-alpha-glucan branching protein GlgB [Tomitella fengzijianii]|uniref:1,4-alpha-glucan branching enzyme n=1 Tax=Tomitella fengzijianii TaxID=2597660 RepID=A0A516X3X5_9ACTN|nr:1,4-alpha-glucan branching protein GlgB [Tomitella fengzijianii]QDQ97767.1 1,4-alpha-glucan branching protein GlgB [Tomitella fengzijianii]